MESEELTYQPIPAGTSRVSLFIDLDQEEDKNCTRNIYKQENESTCMVNALANGVAYYLGNTKSSNRLADHAKIVLKSENAYKEIMEVSKKCVVGHMVDLLCDPELPQNNYDPFHDISNYPTLMIPVASDGGCNHAICFVNKWVFDSNLDYPMKLSKKLLDWCVSTDEESSTYLRPNFAMRLIPEPPMFPKHLICIKESPLHLSLAMFLYMMGEYKV
jgi:hypothetical protein